LSLFLNKLLIRVAYQYNCFLDKPNIRSSHAKIIPRCGGLPIFFILLVGYWCFFRSTDFKVIGYLWGAILIFIVGVIDDLVSMSGKPKIAGMVLCSLIPLLFCLKLDYLGIIGNNQSILYVLSFIWIYGFINAFNFMDGIDGLIGGTSIIGAFFIMVVAFMIGDVLVAGIASLLLSACIGFMVFNYPPAKIFLGDAGSMFLGYNFAVLGIMLTNNSVNAIPIYVVIFIFAPIIYDSMVTFIRRGLQGKNVIEAHREHLYQRLIILGMSHRDVSLIYYVLALLFGLFALIFSFSNIVGRLGIIIIALAILVGFSLAVKQLELSFSKRKTSE